MTGRNALVLAVDGLRASALGAYGNSWHPTPALDALAAQSLVVDWMWCDSPELAGFYRAVWGQDDALPRRLAEAGVATSLVTDAAELGDASSFADACLVESSAEAPADDESTTTLAGLLAVAVERLQAWRDERRSGSRLLWIHARGYRGPWDAPPELRAGLLDEGDPHPSTIVAPPRFEATDDHDLLLSYRAAYAAQSIVLDQCVGGLLAALADLEFDENTLVILIGCRGFALGEHGVAGGDFAGLYSETLHVPCLLCMPGAVAPPPRLAGFAQPVDLRATLASWFGVPHDAGDAIDLLAARAGADLPRPFATAQGTGGEQALRTSEWLLRVAPPPAVQHTAGADDVVELYAKPDDRWEANEVADRCGEVVAELLAKLRPPGLQGPHEAGRSA
jgi:arylsulfatase A-like enzyme